MIIVTDKNKLILRHRLIVHSQQKTSNQQLETSNQKRLPNNKTNGRRFF